MSLIVEDGTGKADAESYVTVNEADLYHLKRAREATWVDLDLEAKEGALRLATDYMLQQYRRLWRGYKTETTQRLDWPRVEAPILDSYNVTRANYTNSDIPLAVKEACCELALRATTQPLSPDLAPPVAEKTVGPITIKYVENSRQTIRYAAVDDMLAPLLFIGSAMMGRVSRS